MTDQLVKRQILIATHNPDKLREIRQILADIGWDVIGLDSIPPYPEPPEDQGTLQGNALQKAHEGFRRSGILTLADDSGLEVDALNGRPGIYSARYASDNATYADNVNLLSEELSDAEEQDRTARFRCVMALVGNGVEQTWSGTSEGVITTKPIGFDGFGYDPIFFSPELGKTFAEASPEEKNRVSHRGRALVGLKEILSTI